jgi:hypothetical protein
LPLGLKTPPSAKSVAHADWTAAAFELQTPPVPSAVVRQAWTVAEVHVEVVLDSHT